MTGGPDQSPNREGGQETGRIAGQRPSGAPGSKWTAPDGTRAVVGGRRPGAYSASPREQKPQWLRVRWAQEQGSAGQSAQVLGAVRRRLRTGGLHSVCEEARCPNLPECFSRGTATFMLLGAVCTRACGFCHVATGNPRGRLDGGEPQRVAEAVADMGLQYVVLTSVNRDDLDDGGAAAFAATVRAIRRRSPQTQVEVLTPDFQGRMASVEAVVDSGVLVFAHNLETVRALSPQVRDPRADHGQSLAVLAHARRHRADLVVKSGLLLGLGESEGQVRETLAEMAGAGVDSVTLGQYLRPTRHHLPIAEWITPARFDAYREMALGLGFSMVTAGPMVRSSYRAEQAVGLRSHLAQAPGLAEA